MKNASFPAKPISNRQFLEGGLAMKSLLRTSIVLATLLLIVPLNAMAEQYKIDRPIFGFYLGESKQSLLQRATQAGITYDKKEITGNLFPSGYFFHGSLNKSKLVSHSMVFIYNDYVAQIDIYLNDSSKQQFLQVAQVIGESWNIAPTFSEEDYGSSYIFVGSQLGINLTCYSNASVTRIQYLHTGLYDARKQALANDQF
jgi:hypothetical protein